MDPETLWDRVNDAIDTIIRRDETETGQLLPPCIEGTKVHNFLCFSSIAQQEPFYVAFGFRTDYVYLV